VKNLASQKGVETHTLRHGNENTSDLQAKSHASGAIGGVAPVAFAVAHYVAYGRLHDAGDQYRRRSGVHRAGKSSVGETAELTRGTLGGPELLQNFRLSANSGRMPGMGVGAAAGEVRSAATAVSGGAHAAGEVKRSPVADQAADMADALSGHLRQYFASQHWIARPAAPGQ
jgi:hypothetical protein